MDPRRPPSVPPRCLLCRSFRATWSPQTPRECRAYGFRSREYPSAVVQRLTGRPCELFAERPAAAGPPRS